MSVGCGRRSSMAWRSQGASKTTVAASSSASISRGSRPEGSSAAVTAFAGRRPVARNRISIACGRSPRATRNRPSSSPADQPSEEASSTPRSVTSARSSSASTPGTSASAAVIASDRHRDLLERRRHRLLGRKARLDLPRPPGRRGQREARRRPGEPGLRIGQRQIGEPRPERRRKARHRDLRDLRLPALRPPGVEPGLDAPGDPPARQRSTTRTTAAPRPPRLRAVSAWPFRACRNGVLRRGWWKDQRCRRRTSGCSDTAR